MAGTSSKKPAPFFRQSARIGCIATALVYIILGVVALLSLLGLKKGGADEASILRFLEDVPFGKVVISLILLGMVAYIGWRFYEAFEDPYGYGRQPKGLAIRMITAFSAVSDALIGWPALASLLGTNTALKDGQPVAQRQMAEQLVQNTGGVWIVALIGIITIITAFVQFVYVFKEAYEERIDFEQFGKTKRKVLHALSYAGHFARGTILGIIGFFLLKAAFAGNGQYVVNTDKAFDFIGDEISPYVFAFVALGTICYGLFMVAMGYYYDFRKGK